MAPHWGNVLFYLGLFALLTAEEAGVFLLPGDISVVAAGVYAAQGGPFILVSWALAVLGMVTGACILFFSVRRSRRSMDVLPARIRSLVHRFGPWGIGVARLVPGLRNATVFAAAAASLPPHKFLVGLIPAAVIWSGALLCVGYFGGNGILVGLGYLDGQPLVKAVSVGLVVCAALFWLIRMRSATARRPSDVQ